MHGIILYFSCIQNGEMVDTKDEVGVELAYSLNESASFRVCVCAYSSTAAVLMGNRKCWY